MVALIYNHKWIEMIDNLEQRGFVRVFNGTVRLTQYPCKRGKIAVFLKCLSPLFFAGAERIIGQHHDRKLLCNGRRVEILSVQKLLLGVDLHTAAKIHVDLLSIGVPGILQRLLCLSQNGIGRNQPHHSLCFGHRERLKNRANRIAGNQRLAAARRHFEAEVRNAGDHVPIQPQRWCALLLPEGSKRRFVAHRFM